MLILKGPVRPVCMKPRLAKAFELRGALRGERVHFRNTGSDNPLKLRR